SGLKTFQENPHINLILMDIRLPDVNGLEIIQKMREHNTTIPIIVQTAYAMSADRKKSIKTGANDYIAKPIDVYDLLSIIGKYI
ncbi:MAG: response regulator, partial [bacterium]